MPSYSKAAFPSVSAESCLPQSPTPLPPHTTQACPGASVRTYPEGEQQSACSKPSLVAGPNPPITCHVASPKAST